MQKVSQGDKLRIPADVFNAFVDAAEHHRQLVARFGAGAIPLDSTDAANCQVSSTLTTVVPAFGVLGLGVAPIDPATHETEFISGPLLNGVTPTDPTHRGKFAIIGPGCQPGELAQGQVAGVAICRVNVTDTGHGFADVDSGRVDRLKSAAIGAAKILWAQAGTGIKWAIVHLGPSAGGADFDAIIGPSSGYWPKEYQWDESEPTASQPWNRAKVGGRGTSAISYPAARNQVETPVGFGATVGPGGISLVDPDATIEVLAIPAGTPVRMRLELGAGGVLHARFYSVNGLTVQCAPP